MFLVKQKEINPSRCAALKHDFTQILQNKWKPDNLDIQCTGLVILWSFPLAALFSIQVCNLTVNLGLRPHVRGYF